MFANDKSIDTLEELFKETKKYLQLQGEYVKLDLVHKLTILLSTLMLILVIAILGAMGLFYLSFMLIYAIDSAIHSLTASYAIVGASLLLAAFIVYKMRQKLIFRPTVNFLAQLFLEDHQQ